MNILFYNNFEVSPTKGGTERITASLAEGLSKFEGVKCFSLYRIADKSGAALSIFEKKLHLISLLKEKETLRKFLIDNDIDIIVNQQAFTCTKLFRELLPSSKKVVFVHHFAPGSEEDFFTAKSHWHERKSLKGGYQILRWTVKGVLYPYYRHKFLSTLKESYKNTYLYADKVVLLSKSFTQNFIDYGGVAHDNDGKIIAIQNSLSFLDFFPMDKYNEKQKEVLIVSRLVETPKKISYALRIWEKIELQPDLKDWHLIIVGHGEDEKRYKQFVKKRGLKRVYFKGRCNPRDYYNKAALFMLTSSKEGWGLTLTEAQQSGCVPLAFYSYASLPDIINNGENGVYVTYPDINAYSEKMIELMRNPELRRRMAEKAVISAHRFENESICQQWMNLFIQLMAK